MRDTGETEARVRGQSLRLGEKIAHAQRRRAGGTADAGSGVVPEMSGMGRALRLGTEFIAAILVGAAMGYLLDRWLNSAPWIMLVMLMIGFAAGVLNVARAANEMNRASPPPAGSDMGPGDDEEQE